MHTQFQVNRMTVSKVIVQSNIFVLISQIIIDSKHFK